MKLYADLPVWLIPVFISLIVFITSRYVIKTKSFKRWLAALRGLIWIILILLAANPWLSWQEISIRFPAIGIWVDQSQSVQPDNLSKLTEIISGTDSADFTFIDLNSGIPIEAGEISSKDPYTDFSKLEHPKIKFEQEWLISDGNANRGKRNIEIAKARTLNVILVGDTVIHGDMAISDINSPLNMYEGVEDTIFVYLSSSGYDDTQNGFLYLRIGQKQIYQRRFSLHIDGEVEVKIPIRFNKRGQKSIIAEIIPDQKDANPLNNLQVIQINVAKKQKEILLLNGYPIPEIRYFRFFLQNIRKYSIIDGSPEYWQKMSSLPDAIILFAFPKKKLTAREIEFWKKANEKKIPVLFFSHESVDFQQLKKLNLPFAYDLTKKPEVLPLEISAGAVSNPIINPELWARNELQKYISEAPPVVRDFRIKFKSESEVLIKSLKDNQKEGFFLIGKDSRRHVALIAGWNSYLLHTSSLANNEYPFWQKIMIALTDWLTAPPLSKGLYYQLPDTLVQSAGSNRLDIRVINTFGQYVTDANLSFAIRQKNWLYENKAQYSGFKYTAELPFMPVGNFELDVKAQWGMGEKLEKKSRFFVANIGPEKRITHRNEHFLRSFATGRFVDISELNNQAFMHKKIKKKIYKELYLFPRKWILWVIILLFILDLYLRKKFQIL